MADVLASWLPTEPKNWKTAIVVIWLDNSSYLCQSCLVLVGTFAAVMERLLEVRITITRSVIDRSDEIYLPTGTQVVNKTWWKVDLRSTVDLALGPLAKRTGAPAVMLRTCMYYDHIACMYYDHST